MVVEADLFVAWGRLAVFDLGIGLLGIGIARQEVVVVTHIPLEMLVEESGHVRVRNAPMRADGTVKL